MELVRRRTLHWSVTNKPQMNADERRYKHEQTTREIIGVFFDVYNELGYGFLESVYREAMTIALQIKDCKSRGSFLSRHDFGVS
jgi:hypothetical protein